MPKSYNGWPASKTLATRTIQPVRGVKLTIVDNANVATIFSYLVKQYNARVEPVHGKTVDDWGYSYRVNVNNPAVLSNHASGTAVDLNAMRHPNDVATKKTFTQKQVNEIHKILAELDHTVAWGGDYTHTVDAMHFEINVPPGHLQHTATKIRNLPKS